ncbi:PEP-CTERM sorting domain-containing protein [Opitutales bacterium]|nr:PEP-CTERM sorting domain-containing protein [Opitutales bacterium]
MQRIILKSAIALIVALIVALSTNSAHAVITVWTGTAELTTLESNLVGLANQGDSVQVQVTYNNSTSPSFTSSSETHYGFGADISMTITIGSNVWQGTQDTSPAVRTAVVQDNANNAVDNLIFILQDGWSTAGSNSQVSGQNANRLLLVFSGSTSLFPSDSLPSADQVNLNQLNQFFGYIENDDVHSRFTGVASTVTVPEPSSALLIGLGVLGLVLGRRNR